MTYLGLMFDDELADYEHALAAAIMAMTQAMCDREKIGAMTREHEAVMEELRAR